MLVALLAVERDWVDYVGLGLAAMVAVITLGAVAVALFGPTWRTRRKRPELELTSEGEEWEASYSIEEADRLGEHDVGTISLLLHNKSGKDTAQDVEVSISVGGWHLEQEREQLGGLYRVLDQQNLTFTSGLTGESGSRASTVPAGFSRRVHLATIGSLEQIALMYPEGQDAPYIVRDSCGAFELFPARADRLRWMVSGCKYEIELTVTGSNFDAIHYAGTLECSREEYCGTLWISRIWWREPLSRVSEVGSVTRQFIN